MVAPLTKTREHKKELLKEIIRINVDLISYPKGCLDRMDLRVLKQITKKLNELKERAKPV
jgi:hypothetical protein